MPQPLQDMAHFKKVQSPGFQRLWAGHFFWKATSLPFVEHNDFREILWSDFLLVPMAVRGAFRFVEMFQNRRAGKLGPTVGKIIFFFEGSKGVR